MQETGQTSPLYWVLYFLDGRRLAVCVCLEDKFYLSTNQSTVFHVSNVLRISDLAFLMKFLIGHNTI